MTDADVPFADAVRSMAGWNQTMNDWRRFLQAEPEGCFLAEWDGIPVGTATTICYGTELAWIGMVLVHPDFRRRGIGTALLEQCLQYLQSKKIQCIKLDATPQGKEVYDKLGFKDEWTLTRWSNPSIACSGPIAKLSCVVNSSNLCSVKRLDTMAFGVSRFHLLEALSRQSTASIFLKNTLGDVDGYGFIRAGTRAFYLGPIVAISTEVALNIVEYLLAQHAGQPVYWDIPDPNHSLTLWAQQHGFTAQRQLIRMHLGENHKPGCPAMQIALTAPETG